MSRLAFAGGGIVSLAIGLDHGRADRGRSRADVAQPGRPVAAAGRRQRVGRGRSAARWNFPRPYQKSTVTRTPRTSAFFNGAALCAVGIRALGLTTYCRSRLQLEPSHPSSPIGSLDDGLARAIGRAQPGIEDQIITNFIAAAPIPA